MKLKELMGGWRARAFLVSLISQWRAFRFIPSLLQSGVLAFFEGFELFPAGVEACDFGFGRV